MLVKSSTEGYLLAGYKALDGIATQTPWNADYLPYPRPTGPFDSAIKFEFGTSTTCGSFADGTVQCTSAAPGTPAVVAGLTNVIDISVGDSTYCAVISDGRVMFFSFSANSLRERPSNSFQASKPIIVAHPSIVISPLARMKEVFLSLVIILLYLCFFRNFLSSIFGPLLFL